SAIETIHGDLVKIGEAYWAVRTKEYAQAAGAWIAYARGETGRALKLIRQAADSEDGSVKHVAMENRLYPLRELMADMLLEMGRPADALREYERALKSNPGRLRALIGAARAAKA